MNKILKMLVVALCAFFLSFNARAASVVTVRVLSNEWVGLNTEYWAGIYTLEINGNQKMIAMNTVGWTDAFFPLPWYTDGSSWDAMLYTHEDITSGAPVTFNPNLYQYANVFLLQGALGYAPQDPLWAASHNEMVINTLSDNLLPPLWSYSNMAYEGDTKLIDIYNSMLPVEGSGNYYVLNALSPGLPLQRVGEFIVLPTFSITTPLPSAVWLFGSGLLGLVAFSRRR